MTPTLPPDWSVQDARKDRQSVTPDGQPFARALIDGVVARVSLGTGAVELAPTPCTAVTTWRGRVLVQDQIGSDPVLDLYASWADVLATQPLWSFSAPGLFSETLTTQADVLYAAWHSDDHVDRFDLPCGEPLGPITAMDAVGSARHASGSKAGPHIA